MRMQGQLRMGFYPADPDLVKQISGWLDWPADKPAVLFDPCCGQGEALAAFGPESAQRYAVELARDRHALAAERFGDRVLNGGFEHLQSSERCFSACWLNPPYDDELGGGRRCELTFVRKATRLLIEGGVVVFMFSERAWDQRMSKFLQSHYEDLRMFKHPPTSRPGYSYIGVHIVIAKRRRYEVSAPKEWWIEADRWPESQPRRWVVPGGHEPRTWAMGGMTDPELCELADRSSLWRRHTTGPVEVGRPLLPLKIGHIPMVLASGRLNGCIGDHYARAQIEKYYVTTATKTDEDGDVTALVQTQRLRLTIKCLAKKAGRVQCVSFGQEKKKDEEAQ